MKSIQSQVNEELKKDCNLTLNAVTKLFPDINYKTISSCYRRCKKSAEKSAVDAEHISMEQMEKLIMNRLKTKPSLPELKLAVDFLKIKQQDHSELQEIDLEIFYKKAMEE